MKRLVQGVSAAAASVCGVHSIKR